MCQGGKGQDFFIVLLLVILDYYKLFSTIVNYSRIFYISYFKLCNHKVDKIIF
jgi:hypothetical protein